MDGNGRWAKSRGLPRIKGHEAGAESIRAILRACQEIGVEYLTLYAFSVENWVRPKAEIAGLMRLLYKFLTTDEHELHEREVRLRVIGRIDDLPVLVRRELKRVIAATEDYKKGQLILALSYGGRAELVDAVKELARQVKEGKVSPSKITEDSLRQFLYAPDIPDPDLLIRTSGEQRLSNFLLWQSAYTEFYFTDVLWPDFREKHFQAAIEVYGRRHRRFGNIS